MQGIQNYYLPGFLNFPMSGVNSYYYFWRRAHDMNTFIDIFSVRTMFKLFYYIVKVVSLINLESFFAKGLLLS
jgi:hypothetical protein